MPTRSGKTSAFLSTDNKKEGAYAPSIVLFSIKVHGPCYIIGLDGAEFYTAEFITE